jgi:hypothetical protein
MAQSIILKRSSLPGKVPDTGSLNVGEIAINTYDGKLFIKRSGNLDSIQGILVTNSTTTGSISLTQTGSFSELVVTQDANISRDLYVTNDIIGAGDIDISGNITGSSALLSGSLILTGSQTITNDLTVLGTVNARQFNISVISSSVLFESGSSRFGNTSDDTHDFTGSVSITGSFLLNGAEVGGGTTSGSFTGSFTGDGSGLRGVVSDDIPRDGWDYNVNSSASISDFNVESDKYYIDFEQSQSTAVGTPVGYKGFLTNVSGSTQILPTLDGIDFVVGNNVVASIGVGGIISTVAAGTVSGSSQLTSSYDSRYVLSGSITQTTWDNIASKPAGIVSGSAQTIANLPTGVVSGSSQLTASALATTGSNSFIGNQSISGTIYLTGSIIPSGSFVYDLGSETNSFRDLFLSTGSIRFHNPDGTEQGRITVDARSGDISLLKTAGLTNEQKATIGQGNINPDFLSAVSASNLFVQNKIVMPIGGTVNGINLTAFSSSVANTILNQNTATSSYETKGRGIVSGSSQITYASISSIPSSIVSGSSQIDVISTTNIARLATTGSNTFFGTQTFSGSVYIANDLIVQGSSSIQYISASSVSIGTNIIQLNTANPSVRYAGLTIIDSGSVGGSGSFLYDSVQDEFIFVHRGNGINVTSSHFILGPETYDNLGNETYLTNNRIPKGTGIEHLNDSNISDTGTLITLGSNTVVNGTLLATGTTLVSSSAQVIGILSSLNTYTGSNDTTNTAQNARLTTIESVTGSYETKGRGIVSGSSQIDVMSTTNIARLATTGSNQFTGSQFITGSITLTGDGGAGGQRVTLNNTGAEQVQYALVNGGTSGTGIFGIRNGSVGTNLILLNSTGTLYPAANGTQDLGSATNRWSTVYTSDLSLNNGIGDWTIVEGEDDLFLYNNKKGKVYKFALTEVAPNVATPKKS